VNPVGVKGGVSKYPWTCVTIRLPDMQYFFYLICSIFTVEHL